MKKMFMAVIALMMTISASAQFYIYCSDGNVIKVDSISMIAPSENVDPYNGHEYVDLGLSVKWATCNVGATSPEDYGDYFAWGEIEPKETYSWATYKWCDGTSSNMTKYNAADGKTILDPEDDAAQVQWGGNWRMPTEEEQQELIDRCSWERTNLNGVIGYKVTGPNGNSIFLPAAGFRDGSSLYNAGSDGNYWSSLLSTVRPDSAWRVLYFGSSNVGRGYDRRSYGFSVRPVCQ